MVDQKRILLQLVEFLKDITLELQTLTELVKSLSQRVKELEDGADRK